ncbi:MAG: MarR family transcriptional regulator [Pseudomonadota bacterium]
MNERAMRQFSESLPMLLYGALDAVMPRFRRIFKDFGITEQQWRVLRVLWEHDRIGFGRLAELTRIAAPSLVGVVDRVIAMGLVVRERSEEDRRVVYIAATAEGRRLQREVMPRVVETYAELRATLDDATWSNLLDGLKQVAALDPLPLPSDRAAND